MSIRKRWAFLVGINGSIDYLRLQYCVDDVLALETLLNSVGYGVVCLHDRQDPTLRRYPTLDNILAEFDLLLKKVQSNDLLLVYFACHGIRGNDGQPRLIARDTRKIHAESKALSISVDLEPRIKDCPAQQKVLMLDACFMGQGRGDGESLNPAAFIRRVNELATGYQVIAASDEKQEALESSGLKHSIFCYYVLKGLAGEADIGKIKQGVTINDLKNYVLDGVERYALEFSLDQDPQGRSEGNLGDFLLVDYQLYPYPMIDVVNPSAAQSETALTTSGRGGQSLNSVTGLSLVTQLPSPTSSL